MHGNPQVETKALAFPSIKLGDKKLKPVVVKTQQGTSPSSNEENELQPAGPADLKAGGGGGWFSNFKLPWTGGKSEAQEENKRFKLRLFHLVDISKSMNRKLDEVRGNPTRLAHVKASITKLMKKLPDDLKAGIENILIPYDNDSGAAQVYSDKQESKFLAAVNSLTKGAGTDIFKPIESVVNFIRQEADDHVRNLAILFSDGEHWPTSIPGVKKTTAKEAIDNFANLEQVDAALFNVGISSDYERDFLFNALRKAKFGGIAHIPNSAGHANLYEQTLPEFIRELTTAPYYPVINFNRFFDRVVALKPTARQLSREANGSFETHHGYQNEAFSTGFIEEDKFDQAEITKTVKDKASSSEIIESGEVRIIDEQDAALDPSDRKIYERFLALSIKNLLIESDDPAEALKEFLEENNDNLPPGLRENLEQLVERFDGDLNEQDRRSALSEGSAIQSVLPDRTLVDPADEMPSIFFNPGDVNTVANDADGNYTIAIDREQMVANAGDSIIHLPQDEIEAYNLSFDFNGLEFKKIAIENGGRLVLGRADTSDVIIKDERASRSHAEITMKDGTLWLKDLDSSNGTQLNRRKLDQNESAELKSGDEITIGQTSFTLNLKI